MHTIFTYGYTATKPADLLAHVERLGATLVDIRHSPYSRAPQWQGSAIRQLVGFDRYIHIQDLGNVNYKSGGPIRLLNPTAAVPRIRELLLKGPVILLCACKDVATCHRRDAADYLHDTIGADVEHLTTNDDRPTNTMKALSLMQPWASLLVLGQKAVETRSWATAYRGPVAIHASKAMPRTAHDLCFESPFVNVLRLAGLISRSNPVYKPVHYLPLGVVLGTVEIVDCIPTEVIAPTLTTQELAFGDYTPGRWAWVCRNPIQFEQPIPARGALQLWNWQVPEGLTV